MKIHKMKIYLGGGRSASKGEKSLAELHTNLEQIFTLESTKEILHIPFSRPGFRRKNIGDTPEFFRDYIQSLGIKYLNAQFIEDIEEFSGDTIYINGGDSCEFSLKSCKEKILYDKILQTKTIIGNSCGAMIFGEYFRDDKAGTKRIKGLGIVKDTNIEPHYTEKNKESRLKKSMAEKNIPHGLGIDVQTYIEYENGKYGTKIGSGEVFYI